MSNNETELFKKFGAIMWQMHSYTRRNRQYFGPEGNPLQGQGRVLALLKLQPEISQKDLAYLLNMRPQSLGELLAKLEKAGYITRAQSEDDRRVVIIRLTDEGRKAAERQSEGAGEPAGLFDCLSEEEQKTLSEYLDRIMASLREKTGDAWPFFSFDGQGGFEARAPFEGRGRGFVGFDWAGGKDGFRFNMRRGPGPCGPDGCAPEGGFGPGEDPGDESKE